jgi:hypothetical protein
MSPLTAAIVASEEAGGAVISPYAFGAVALVVLVGLLIVTMLINVDR